MWAELGYDLFYPYKTVEEEEEMSKKKDLDRTILLTERHQIATDLTFKLRNMHQVEQQKLKMERELKAKQL